MAELDTLNALTRELDGNRSFLLEAGAGSGKTTALVHGLRHLMRTRRADLAATGQRIACITYTNVAKNEISERIDEDPLVYVGTIHEFLWSLVQGFQPHLKKELIDYNQTLRTPAEDLTDLPADLRITYTDRGRRFSEGQISHDEVLELSYRMICRYPKLARLIADRYPVIFVDEYQDTSPQTITLLLDHLAGAGASRCLVGLFGDSMQMIYRTGVGTVADTRLTRLTKQENYRSAPQIVAVLNKIRPDLVQYPASDLQDGEVLLFLDSAVPPGPDRLESARVTLAARGWPQQDTKYLMLTHRSIASTLEYPSLLDLYSKRGRNGRVDLLEANEPYAQLTEQIEALCQAYEGENYAELARLLGGGGMAVDRHSRKAQVARTLRELISLKAHATIGEVVDFAAATKLLPKPRKIRAAEQAMSATGLDEIDQRRADFARNLRAIPYREVTAVSTFRNEQTPFSTQHGVKGDEFDYVVVIIDDNSWNQYNMGKMMAGTDKPERTQRSRNLFYVCCSRARRGLAVVFLTDLPHTAIPVAREWFTSATIIT